MKHTKTIYTCDICGKKDEWGDTWYRYSSILLDEVCPDQVPHTCSDKCRDILNQKLKSGEIELPLLMKSHGAPYYKVKRGKIGY